MAWAAFLDLQAVRLVEEEEQGRLPNERKLLKEMVEDLHHLAAKEGVAQTLVPPGAEEQVAVAEEEAEGRVLLMKVEEAVEQVRFLAHRHRKRLRW